MKAAVHKDKAYFCPKCGTPAVTLSVLSGGDASCEKCSWTGKNTELTAFSFEHDMGSQEGVTRAFANDMREAFTQAAMPLGRVLMKWGFFKSDPTAAEFVRYLTAITRAGIIAVIEERQKTEKTDA